MMARSTNAPWPAADFIQTALREWVYAQAYPTSDRRPDELPVWLHKSHKADIAPHGGTSAGSFIQTLTMVDVGSLAAIAPSG